VEGFHKQNTKRTKMMSPAKALDMVDRPYKTKTSGGAGGKKPPLPPKKTMTGGNGDDSKEPFREWGNKKPPADDKLRLYGNQSKPPRKKY